MSDIALRARYLNNQRQHEYEVLGLDPARTALLIVDVYLGEQYGEDIEGVTGNRVKPWWEAMHRCKDVLDAARSVSLPVVYVMNSSPRIALNRSAWGRHFKRSWETDFDLAFREGGVDAREYHGGRPGPLQIPPGLEPIEGEYYVRKHVYSGFFDSRLDTLLRNLGIEAVVMAGMWADVCMLTTAYDAFYRNYEVIWVRDGTMSGMDPARDGSMPATEQVADTVEWAIGYTVTSAEFTAACGRAVGGVG